MREKRKNLIKGSVWRSGEAECVKLDLIKHGTSGEDVMCVLRRGVAHSTDSIETSFLFFVGLPRLLKPVRACVMRLASFLGKPRIECLVSTVGNQNFG